MFLPARFSLFVGWVALGIFCLPGVPDARSAHVFDLSTGWKFHLGDIDGAAQPQFDDAGWEIVDAPHPARLEARVTSKQNQQWEGICWYRKHITLPQTAKGQVVRIRFEGAMNRAELFINGEKRSESIDGYTPFVADISDVALSGRPVVVALRLDNTHNPVTGPKPLATLDFHMYHGLYRRVSLSVQPPLHITDEILENLPASGGVFVRYPEVSDERARVSVQTHVRNRSTAASEFALAVRLQSLDGRELVSAELPALSLAAEEARAFTQELTVQNPALWSPLSPNLHYIVVELKQEGRVIDRKRERIGIRRIELGSGSLMINGKKHFLRGVNRHQEYPYVGFAVPPNAQYRDAVKIKEAGFDYVRLSHYPHSPEFMDACDELGLITMNAILGWQFNPGTAAFMENRLNASRALVRRDRNHPSSVLWELALNETRMSPEFIQQLHTVGHEEYPGDQMFTAGWTKGYDVKVTARQHKSTQEFKDATFPCVVSEYGDWEYYAQNAGLNQDQWQNLKQADRSSRQLRGDGEVRLLQQATNLQEAHNENRSTRAFADGYWVMFDYNRGYADDHEASGVMDIFRLPKFSYYFFQSQRDAAERIAGIGGPMVLAATWWTESSPLEVRVFSNCDEVELFVNGRSVGRRKPDQNRMSEHLAHPPFTFPLQSFEPGELKAVAFLNGRETATHVVRTPGKPAALRVNADLAGRTPTSGGDLVFLHASVVDANGTVVPGAAASVRFKLVAGDGKLVGENPIAAEAGIATVLLQTGKTGGRVQVRAEADELSGEAVFEVTQAPVRTRL